MNPDNEELLARCTEAALMRFRIEAESYGISPMLPIEDLMDRLFDERAKRDPLLRWLERDKP